MYIRNKYLQNCTLFVDVMSFTNEAIKWLRVLKSLSELFKIKIEVRCAHVSVLSMFLFVSPSSLICKLSCQDSYYLEVDFVAIYFI